MTCEEGFMAGKRRVMILAGLAVGAVALAALPVLRSSTGGEASAQTVPGSTTAVHS